MLGLKKTDILLLKSLQTDSTIGLAELAESVGLSRTSCWRRIKEFEEVGLIDRQVTILDPSNLGLKIYVLLSVSLKEHSSTTGAEFEEHIFSLPEVTECYSVSGDRDYVLHVLTRDMEEYADFLNLKILQHPLVHSASSSFALRRVKYTTELPIA